MNRREAKKIAETISNVELSKMLENAKNGITDWTERSIVNKSATKGLAWNILGKDFDVDDDHHLLYKINLVREYGEYLPTRIKGNKTSKILPILVHQKPIF